MPETTSTVMVLNSWKEIASYVGRGVRTVQRWEADLGMPVRRPRAKSRSAVIAMSDEIDQWLRSAPTTELPVMHSKATETAIFDLEQSLAENVSLRHQCRQLSEVNKQVLASLMVNLASMKREMEITMALRESRGSTLIHALSSKSSTTDSARYLTAAAE